MKILIIGTNGLLGSSIKRISNAYKHQFIFINREYGDLTIKENIYNMYNNIQPDYVINAAAKVGGIAGHLSGQADFFIENILMNTFIIDYAYKFKIKKLIMIGSICMLPDNMQILSENNMHSGPPYQVNFAYAYAKRMIDIQIQAYQSQYNIKNYCTIVPCNIYGINDKYDTQHGHVLPSLIHKIFIAKKNNTDLEIWGDGKARREFIYVDDLSNIILTLLDKIENLPTSFIVSNPTSYSIKEIVEKLVTVSCFKGRVIFNTNKPVGQLNRPTDISLLQSYLPNIYFTDIDDGLKLSYEWFEKNYPNVKGI